MSFLKNIEYKIKAFFDGMLSSNITPELISHPDLVFNLHKGSKILLLRHDRIGDLLVTYPFVKLLREKFPEIEIDMLLSTKNKSAYRAVEIEINNIYIYEKELFSIIKLISKLRKRQYDILIDLFDNPSTTSSYLIKFIKPKNSLGIDKSNSKIYTHIVPMLDKNSHHIVERIANLLLPFGIKASPSELYLNFNLSSSETTLAFNLMKHGQNRRILGINLAGSSRAKFWGSSNYIKLINSFREKYSEFDIYIFSMPEYKSDLQEIIMNTSAKSAPVAESFVKYASLLSVCDFIFTPDTSTVHLAAAFQIPCVSLHLWNGSADTGLPWYPYNSTHKLLKTNTGSLNDITPDQVLTVLNELIDEGLSK